MSFESADLDTGEDERKRDSSRKRDGKREKREKSYQKFEAEDSDDEPLALADDLKSPSKQKKERVKPSFKFPVSVRKEKSKEKDDKKDKEAKIEEKEKKKEEKEKKKHKKEKKKSKHSHKDGGPSIVEPSTTENPIFGVPLAVAVERNKSHDGIQLPALVRECIDNIEEYGLACEGIYRLSGVKSKVQQLKESYNRGQRVSLTEQEPNVVASLLKLFLRELPEPVLTTELMPRFEEASTIKDSKKKVEAFIKLISELPPCNNLLLSWMIVHMTHVIELAKENKMSLQNVSIVLSPTMQISHRVLNVLFSYVNDLFADVQLRRYVPPLRPAHSKWSLELPDNLIALEEELAKQESLLSQLHAKLHSGKEDSHTSEQLWEVQRVVTQLKRKIKLGKKNMELHERRRNNLEAKRSSTSSLPSLSAPEELHLDLRTMPSKPNAEVEVVADIESTDVPSQNKAESEDTEGKEHDGEKRKSREAGELGKTSGDKDGDEGVAKDSEKQEVSVSEEAKEQNEQAEDKSNVEKKDGTEEVKQSEGIEKFEKVETEKYGEKEKEDVKNDDDIIKEKQADAQVKDGDTKAEDKVDEVKDGELQDSSEEKADGESQVTATVDKESKAEDHDQDDGEYAQKPQKTGEGKAHEAVASVATLEEGPQLIKESPPDVSATASEADSTATVTTASDGQQPEVSEDMKVSDKKDGKKSVKFVTEEEETASVSADEKKTVENEAAAEDSASSASKDSAVPAQSESKDLTVSTQSNEAVVTVQQKPAAKKPRVYEYRKAPNPPFVSTSLLKPMKAEPPKPKPAGKTEDETEAEGVGSQAAGTESWRQLEEELLGQGAEEEEEAEIERLLEEEYALKLEEEELLAIADELRQKLATERSEMERLSQEITELQYLRQDSDLEDLSSASSSSSDSEDEDDLQGLLGQLIQDNQELEMKSADYCQKIHEERMICLSVKLQIRLLQQRQLESSYG